MPRSQTRTSTGPGCVYGLGGVLAFFAVLLEGIPLLLTWLVHVLDLNSYFTEREWHIAPEFWTLVAVFTLPAIVTTFVVLLELRRGNLNPVGPAVAWGIAMAFTLAAVINLLGGRNHPVLPADLSARLPDVNIWAADVLRAAGSTLLVAMVMSLAMFQFAMKFAGLRRRAPAIFLGVTVVGVLAVGWMAGSDYF